MGVIHSLILVVGAAVWRAVERAAEPPIMRRRVNAGTDRYLARRRQAGRGRSDGGTGWAWTEGRDDSRADDGDWAGGDDGAGDGAGGGDE